MRLSRAILAAPLLAVPLVAVAELGRRASPSPVIFPTQTIPLSYSHEQHLRLDMACVDCHEAAPGSTTAAQNLIPGEKVCTECHEIERDKPGKQVPSGSPDAKCDSCHPGFRGEGEPARVVIPTPNLKFNHKVHIDRKIRCQVCHGDFLAEGVGLATREQLPRMATCLSCHDGKTAPSRCTTCHIAEPGGFVKTEYAEGSLVPSGVLRGDAHDLRFRTEHAKVGKTEEKYCASCHKKDFCVGCHNGVEKPMDFHGNDYVTLHAVDARRNDPDCSACHRLQTFCTGCHARSGVSDDPKTSEFERASIVTRPVQNRFHPRSWWTGTAADGSHHTQQAQRNLRACASCHREEFCMSCHAGADARSPHPASWIGSTRCEALLARNKRMCLKCHVDPEEATCD